MTNVSTYLSESIHVLQQCVMDSSLLAAVANVSTMLLKAVHEGLPILICGNGGSASDAEHFAAELVCRFRTNRKAINALALSNCGALATAISNDFGYEQVFARQVEAYGKKGGVLIGITTSGRSKNVIEALKIAQSRGMQTVAMTGSHILDVEPFSTAILSVPSKGTPDIIQQAHLCLYHFLCYKLEQAVH